jgi:hypothetical protein
MLHTLLRLPSPGFPEDMLTGDAGIDAYLTTIDSVLAGSAAVRRRTLLEARDYLTEALARARADRTDENVDESIDESAALRIAIEEFGDAEQIAREQRRTCAASFRTLAWRTGLAFATLMLIFSLLGLGEQAMTWPMLAFGFVFNAVFFGFFMAFSFVYLFPQPMPAAQDAQGPGRFAVHYTRMSIRMAWGLAIVFGAMQILLVYGLTGRGLFGDWSSTVLILMLLLNTKTVLAAIDAVLFRARVEADTLHLGGLGGRAKIGRGQIVSVVVPGRLFQLIWPSYANLRRLCWRDDAGRLHRRHLSLNRDLVHGDRLMAWLEDAARENVSSANAACAV